MRVRGWKDLVLVEAGVRSCALVAVAEPDLLDLILTLDSKGLKYMFSSQKLVNRNKVSYGSYAFQRTAIPLESPEEGDILIYVCKSARELRVAEKAEHSHSDTLIGELLDYPQCCIVSFSERFDRYQFDNSILKMIEPYLEMSEQREYSFVINIFARFYDQSILSHYPCRLDCERSIELGFEYLSCLRSADLRLARRLEYHARCELAVSPGVGLWAFRWNRREELNEQSPNVISSVQWGTDQKRDWIFNNDGTFVRSVPGGIILSSKNEEERFLPGYSFHFG
jgi:hypothetical protein